MKGFCEMSDAFHPSAIPQVFTWGGWVSLYNLMPSTAKFKSVE